MIARIITYANQDVGLLVAQPNWASTVTVTLELPTDIAKQPITFNESRRAFAQSSRYSMKWTSYMSNAADAKELRIFLSRIRGETIAVPLWPDGCELTNSIPIGATSIALLDVPVRFGSFWIIANSDFSTWEIVTGTLTAGVSTGTFSLTPGVHNAWPAGTIMYPLLFGYLSERPKPESITDETMEVDLTIKESSNFVSRVTPRSASLPVVGLHIAAFASTPLFDVQPNFSKPLDWTEQPDIIYEDIGFLRTSQQRVFDHRNRRGLEMEFYQSTREDASRVERFWRTQRGPVLRFMIPTWRGDMRMSGDTPVTISPRNIPIEPSEFVDPGREAQPGDPFVALIGPDNSIDPYQLTTTNQSPPTLVATIGVGTHTATNTILSCLLLARFQDPKLQWDYTTPYLATTKLKFVELSHEYQNPPDPLPEPAYLFGFVEVDVAISKFTSYENSISIATGALAGVWTPAPFSFDKVKTGLKLDQEKLDFKSFPFPGNPLGKMFPFALDGSLILFVYEVDARNPRTETAVERFYGDVWSVDGDYKATAIAFGNLFERKFPRFLLMTSDNYVQFAPPTHLPASAFMMTGKVASVNASDPQVITVSGTAATQPDDWFAGGWLESSTGFGLNFERRGILHSSGSTFHLDRPLLKIPLGQQLSFNFYPGYDGSRDQCEAKFNNLINYGGHPFVPNVNPAVKAMKAKQVSGGKKG